MHRSRFISRHKGHFVPHGHSDGMFNIGRSVVKINSKLIHLVGRVKFSESNIYTIEVILIIALVHYNLSQCNSYVSGLYG